MRKPLLIPIDRSDGAPLSYAQEGLWFLQQLDTGDAAYTVPLMLKLRADVDRDRLADALAAVVARHEALRTRIVVDSGGVPRQYVVPAFRPETEWHETASEAEWHSLLAEAMRRPFDLAEGHLIRCVGARMPDGTQHMAVGLHHIAADGWSLRVLARDLIGFYEGTPTPAPAVQYGDFAAWQRGWLAGDTLRDELTYWHTQLTGTTLPRLPTDRPPPAVPDTRAGATVIMLPPEVTGPLLDVGRDERATAFIVTTSVIAALLGRWTGQTDLVVGSALAGRGSTRLADVVGNFVNTIALRIDLSGDPSFRELVRRVRATVLGAMRHADAPFDRVVADVAPRRDLTSNPLFNVALLHQDFPDDSEADGPIELDLRDVAAAVSTRFDLELHTVIVSGHLSTLVLYRRDLLDDATIETLLRRFRALAAAMAADPDAPLSGISLMTDAEWRQQVGMNMTARPISAATMVDLVAAKTAVRPEAMAVVSATGNLTYGDLDRQATERAAELAGLGLAPGDIAGIRGHWHARTIVDALAVMRCGAAYLLLKPDVPDERWTHALAGSPPRLILSDERVEVMRRPAADRPADPPSRPSLDDIAAIVPAPDGAVMVTHGNLVRLASAAPEAVDDEAALLLDQGPLAPWPVLGSGGLLLVAQPTNPPAGEVARHAPTTVGATAEQFADILDTDAHVLASVTDLVAYGDPAALAGLPTTAKLRNAYTRAETGGLCAVHIGPTGGRALIGRPIPNVRLYILDRRLRPVPPGMIGQLYVAGAAVAAGYVDRPAATARAFRPDPFGTPGERMFATGERVFIRPDGVVEWIAREDDQVTIDGERVRPLVAEAALNADPRVRRAVVVPRVGAGRTLLVGHVDAAPDDLADIGRAAASRLAPAERPALLVPAPDLPAEPDRAALAAAPLPAAADVSDAVLAEWERAILGAMRRVLGRADIDVDDSFFDNGGHSLLTLPVMVAIREELGVDLPVSLLFEFPSARALARAGTGQAWSLPVLAPVDIDRSAGAPLSFGQEGLWLLQAMGAATHAYNVPLALRAEAGFDTATFTSAVAGLVSRHEALRTRFAVDPTGLPRQVVDEPYEPDIRWHDLSTSPDAESGWREISAAVIEAPFDLAAGRLMRVVGARLADGWAIALVFHHIVVDGWSLGLLTRDLLVGYAGGTLPAGDIHQIDFAVWQRAWLSGDILRRQLAYWSTELAGAEMLDLPTDRPHRQTPGAAGGVARVRLEPDRAEPLLDLAVAEGTTVFALLSAAFAVLLRLYSGQSDVVFGSVLSGRDVAELAGTVGFFTNTVALRADLSGDPTFRELLARMRTTVMGAFRHQDIPFERVIAAQGRRRDAGRNPLFETVLVHQTVPEGSDEPAALRVDYAGPGDGAGARFDMELHTAVVGGALGGVLMYRSELFDDDTMRTLLDRFAAILDRVAEDPDARLSTMSLLTEPEQAELHGWARHVEPMPPGSVVDLIEARRRARPDAPAVVDAHGTMTYDELCDRADRLAGELRAAGVCRGDVVAVCHPRDAHLVIVLLAVLKAGGAYLAIDPSHPQRRISVVLREARPRLIVVAPDLADALPSDVIEPDGTALSPVVLRYDRTTARPDAAAVGLPSDLGPTDIFNVVYTSGSTGSPAGVAVTHAGVLRLVTGAHHWIDLGPGCRFLQLSPLTFDVSTFELWGPLANGGTTVAVPVDVLADDLGEIYRRYEVTDAHLVAPQLDLVVGRGLPELEPLRNVVVGGDIIKPESFEAVRLGVPGCRITAAYGPTETTVICSVHPGDGPVTGTVPIGRPTANSWWYVLDDHMRPVPVGVRGELYVGGPGVARGYLHRPALTARRFLPDPYGPPGARMYRTGDLARLRADGTAEFFGRADFQVKLRGYRIELAEVENALREHPVVKQAVVALKHLLTGPALVGYLLSDEAMPDLADIRRYLAERLPAYEVPPFLVPLAEFPLTSSKKVDRRALPDPATASGGGRRQPANHLESFLVDNWSTLLGRPISADDDFFLIGGHSLLAVRATGWARNLIGREVPLRLIFDYPTVVGYAEALRKDGSAGDAEVAPASRGTVRSYRWRSDTLDNERRVDLYTPAGFDPAHPGRLLVMVDGPDFVDVVRVPAMLDRLAAAGTIPPTPALFVGHPDWITRNAELAAGVDFVRALIDEAVPLVRDWLGPDVAELSAVFAGASLGGVAAVTAVLERPERVRGAIVMAAPMWWAPTGESEGLIVRRIAAGEAADAKFYLFVGDDDRPTLHDWMGRLRDALAERGTPVPLQRGPGAHTFATWQERLPEALATMFGTW